jgi:hypothetical protein
MSIATVGTDMTSRTVLSFGFLQVGWFACVLGAARGYSWLGSFERRPILGVLLGGFGGPLAYDAGVRLGAIGLGQSRLGALAIIGAAWSLVLPALFCLRRWIGTPHGNGSSPR